MRVSKAKQLMLVTHLSYRKVGIRYQGWGFYF